MLACLQRLDCQGRVFIEGVGEDDPLHVVCQEGIIVLVANSTQGVTGTAESMAVKVADRHDVHAHHLALSSQGEPSSDSNHTHPQLVIHLRSPPSHLNPYVPPSPLLPSL